MCELTWLPLFLLGVLCATFGAGLTMVVIMHIQAKIDEKIIKEQFGLQDKDNEN